MSNKLRECVNKLHSNKEVVTGVSEAEHDPS